MFGLAAQCSTKTDLPTDLESMKIQVTHPRRDRSAEQANATNQRPMEAQLENRSQASWGRVATPGCRIWAASRSPLTGPARLANLFVLSPVARIMISSKFNQSISIKKCQGLNFGGNFVSKMTFKHKNERYTDAPPN